MRKQAIAVAAAVLAVTGCAGDVPNEAAVAEDRRTEIWKCHGLAGGPSSSPTVALTGTRWAATGTIVMAGSPAELTDFGMSGPVRIWSWGGMSMRTHQFHIDPDLTGVHLHFPDGRKTARPTSLHECKLVRTA